MVPEGARAPVAWWKVSETAMARGIALVLFGLFVVLVSLPTAPVLTVASITTERVTYRVLDHAKAVIPVGGMRLGAPGQGTDARCVDGLLQPLNGAEVTYGRTGDGPIEIWVDAGPGGGTRGTVLANLTGAGAASTSFKDGVYLASDKGCGPLQASRLPIWGAARFGDEFPSASGPGRPVPKLLIKGTLKPSARSRLRQVLYPLPDITVPVGSRLEAAQACGNDGGCGVEGGEPSGIWWGTAAADASLASLQVDAATQARELALFRPLRTEAEPIAVSGFTQLTNDPDLLLLQAGLLVILSLVGTAPAIARHAHDLFGWNKVPG